MPELDLESRAGLPEELGYLRAPYPQEAWRGHANFGELARFWLHMDDSLRHHGTILDRTTAQFREGQLDADTFRRSFVPGSTSSSVTWMATPGRGSALFSEIPLARSADGGGVRPARPRPPAHPRGVACFRNGSERVPGRTRQRFDALRGAGDAYAEASAQLLAFLTRHLADEEDLVVPAMLHHGERAIS